MTTDDQKQRALAGLRRVIGDLVVVVTILTLVIAGVPACADETTTARLATIARVWGAVRYAHPYLGYRDDLDWDAAGVEAAERARGSESLETIVGAMLATLGDPMTRVVSEGRLASSGGY